MQHASPAPVASAPANVLSITKSEKQDEDAFLVLTDERTGEVTLFKRVPQAALPGACEEVRYESVRVIGKARTGKPSRRWSVMIWPLVRLSLELVSLIT